MTLLHQCKNNEDLSSNTMNTLRHDSIKGDKLPIINTQPSYSRAFRLVLTRDLIIALRHKDDFLNPLLFFIIIITLFPLGVGPEQSVLSQIAPGIIWVELY
jgi:heme exporter protein B